MSDLADWLAGHRFDPYELRCACGAQRSLGLGLQDAHVAEAFLGLPLQERARLARLPELVEREEWTIVWDDAGRSGGYPSRAVAEAAASRYDQTALAELPWHLESRTWFDTPPTPWAASAPALPADGHVQDVPPIEAEEQQ